MKKLRWYNYNVVPLTVAYIANQKQHLKALKQIERDPEDWPELNGALCVTYNEPGKTLTCFIFVDDTASERPIAEVVGMIAHECEHVKQFLFERIGEHEPSSEFEAYMLQRLVVDMVYQHKRMKRKPWRAE